VERIAKAIAASAAIAAWSSAKFSLPQYGLSAWTSRQISSSVRPAPVPKGALSKSSCPSVRVRIASGHEAEPDPRNEVVDAERLATQRVVSAARPATQARCATVALADVVDGAGDADGRGEGARHSEAGALDR